MDKNIDLTGVSPANTIESVNLIKIICADIINLFENMKSIDGMYNSTIEKYHSLCTSIPKMIEEGVVNIAVIGAIKSGKSTFINSLLMDDILKRGAGVVTSVITRIKRGDTLKAKILFKSWEEINNELQKALTLIPTSSIGSVDLKDIGSIDLRKKSVRIFLESVKQMFCTKQLFEHNYCRYDVENLLSENGLRPEIVLISKALDGYDEVKNFVQNDLSDCSSNKPSYVEFAGETFYEHKRFTGISCNAFFVKDVVIEIPHTNNELDNSSVDCGDYKRYIEHKREIIDNFVEIADCQGIDSTDPSHVLQINDHLLSTNMLIYIISSRVGLRDADIKFLTAIKRMGIINNIFFILNADLNEHDSLESLILLEKDVNRLLSYFVDNPSIYTVSSLFNLFSLLEHRNYNLQSKELSMFRQWIQHTEMVNYTTQNSIEFENLLKQKIKQEGFTTILKSQIQRLSLIAESAKSRNLIFIQLLSGDLKKAAEAELNLRKFKEQQHKFQSSLDDTMKFMVHNIKRDIKSDIKLFFDKKRGGQAVMVKDFIFRASIYNDKYSQTAATLGFNHALYLMFQEFRIELDLFMTQQLNSAVIEFIQKQEEHIKESFETLYQSYYVKTSNIYQNVETADNLESSQSDKINLNRFMNVNLEGTKTILGLSLPKGGFATSYSAEIRADAIVRFSFYSFIDFIKNFMNPITAKTQKSKHLSKNEQILPEKQNHFPNSRALRESAKKIKIESLRSVMLHFDTYADYLQEQYFFPLIDAAARDSKNRLIEMFYAVEIENESIKKLISDNCVDRRAKLELLNSLELEIDNILSRLAQC